MKQTATATRLEEIKNAPVVWGRLRHDRERSIYCEAYFEGRQHEREFIQQRVSDVLKSSPLERREFLSLTDNGYTPGLPPIICELIGRVV